MFLRLDACELGTKVQTGKYRNCPCERNKHGVGDILEGLASGVLRPFVVWNEKQN